MSNNKYDRNQIIEMRHSGLTSKQIAAQLGANYVYISRVLIGVYAVKGCEQCGKEFSPTHSHAIYCCKSCRTKAWKLRNRSLLYEAMPSE